MQKALLVTEDPRTAEAIRQVLLRTSLSLEVHIDSTLAARAGSTASNPDLILVDYCLPDNHWKNSLLEWEKNFRSIPLILFNAPDRADLAVAVMKRGICDYIPINRPELWKKSIERAYDLSLSTASGPIPPGQKTSEQTAPRYDGPYSQPMWMDDNSELFHTLMNAMPDIVCLKDGAGRWLYANNADLELFELKNMDYQGKTDADLAEFSPFYRTPFLNCIESDRAAWAKGTISRVEETLEKPDGSARTFDVYKVPLFNSDGSRNGLVVLGRDITEKMQAEQALLESELTFTQVFHHSPVGLMTFTKEGMLSCNERMATLMDSTREKLMQLKFADVVDKSMAPAVQAALNGREGHYEGLYRATTSQKEIWVSLRTAPLYNTSGEICGGIGMVEDISGRKNTDAQIQSQLQRLAALHNIDVAITSCLDIRMTLSLLLDQALNQLKVDAGDIRLFNKYTQTLDFTAGKGFRTGSLPARSLRLGQGLAGRAALEQKILHYPDPLDAFQRISVDQLMIHSEFNSCYAVPLIAKGQVKGVMEIYSYHSVLQNQEWHDFLNALGVQAAIAIDNGELFDNLQRTNVDLTMAIDSMLAGLAQALDLREGVPVGHSRMLTDLTMRLARVVGMPESELVPLRRGALLHDVGKLIIPEQILWKTSSLTQEEADILNQHPDYAYQILSPISFFHQALEIPYCHHENWDGSGYPRRLKGDQIPFSARIFAVVNAWYKLIYMNTEALNITQEMAARRLQELSGKQFDPKVVAAFIKHIWTEL